MYRGWSDVLKIDQEIDDMLKASEANEQVSDAGISAMLLFLIDGETEENAFELAKRMGY